MPTTAITKYIASGSSGVAPSSIDASINALAVPAPLDYWSALGCFPNSDLVIAGPSSGQRQRIIHIGFQPSALATATVTLGPPPKTPISSTSDGTGAGIISSAGVIGRWPIQQPFPPNGRSIASVAVGAAGAGFGAPPVLSLTGGSGSGAVLQPVMQVDSTGTALVVLGGSGYTSPTVAFVGGLGPNGVAATATLSVSLGVITGITITSGGSGYVGMPTVVITDTAGSGAVIYVALNLKSINIVNPGQGYGTTVPTVTITSLFASLFLSAPNADGGFEAFLNVMTQAIESSLCGPIASSVSII